MGIGKVFYALRKRLFGEGAPIVAVLRLEGVIGAGGRFQQSLSLTRLAEPIERAFTMPGVKAVALAINSPGGSPVQSALILRRIRALSDEKHVPVIAFAEDVAASGGYMLALAGSEIYAHEASIIGSIGVVSSGFGFTGAIDRLGIERRLYTAGAKKSMLDPFLPEDAEDVDRLGAIQKDVHDYFKSLVRDRRGKRLNGARTRIFSGEVFTGEDARKLGLVDGLGDLRGVMRERFGEKVRLRPVEQRRPRLGSFLGLRRGVPAEDAAARALAGTALTGDGLASGLGRGVLAAVEERLWWNRYGL